MEVLPVDLTGLLAVFMGLMTVLIPIAGLTARFALKPLVDSLGQYLQGQGTEESLKIAERRIALLEQNVDALQNELYRVRDVQDFDTALRSRSEQESLPSAPAGAPEE